MKALVHCIAALLEREQPDVGVFHGEQFQDAVAQQIVVRCAWRTTVFAVCADEQGCVTSSRLGQRVDVKPAADLDSRQLFARLGGPHPP